MLLYSSELLGAHLTMQASTEMTTIAASSRLKYWNGATGSIVYSAYAGSHHSLMWCSSSSSSPPPSSTSCSPPSSSSSSPPSSSLAISVSSPSSFSSPMSSASAAASCERRRGRVDRSCRRGAAASLLTCACSCVQHGAANRQHHLERSAAKSSAELARAAETARRKTLHIICSREDLKIRKFRERGDTTKSTGQRVTSAIRRQSSASAWHPMGKGYGPMKIATKGTKPKHTGTSSGTGLAPAAAAAAAAAAVGVAVAGVRATR